MAVITDLKACVLVNPQNNRLAKNRLNRYPSVLPEYTVEYGPTARTVGKVPDEYIEGGPYDKRKRGYCAYLGHMRRIASHYDSHPDSDLLILEDDVCFQGGFDEYYPNFIQKVPDDWDAIHLSGWYVRCIPEEVVDGVLEPDTRGKLVGAECVLLRSSLIKKLVDTFRNPSSIKWQLDNTLAIWARDREIKMYAPVFRLAFQRPGYSAYRKEYLDRNWCNNHTFPYRNINGELMASTIKELQRYKSEI